MFEGDCYYYTFNLILGRKMKKQGKTRKEIKLSC